MRTPKPISLTQIDSSEHKSRMKPKPFVVVGEMPGGGDSGPTAWDDVTGKPAVIGAGATEAEARAAIGAGTSDVVVGTDATNAKAGNYVPDWGEVTGKPSTFPPTIGTTATTAKAGDYQPTWAQVTGKPTTFPPATHDHTIAQITGLQAIITDLTDRIEALEAAAE